MPAAAAIADAPCHMPLLPDMLLFAAANKRTLCRRRPSALPPCHALPRFAAAYFMMIFRRPRFYLMHRIAGDEARDTRAAMPRCAEMRYWRTTRRPPARCAAASRRADCLRLCCIMPPMRDAAAAAMPRFSASVYLF